MEIFADLHIHSKYSRACSKDLNLENIEKWAKIKGLNLVGTSDFTHPEWIKELKRNLIDKGTGVFETQSGFKFILQSEISLIYSQGGKGRRVHLLLFAPNFDAVDKITKYLLKHGRIDYDGRPIFKISCRDIVKDLKEINQDIEIIPAHIWTPWFGMLGSKGGFNSVKECFGDQTKHIKAYETGISSDPQMNWRVPDLDNLTPISNSDTHSFWPWRLGREANVLEINNLSYKNLFKAIYTKKGFKYTIEVDPNYGKYHIDGHRKCNFCSYPDQTKKLKSICPICKKPMVLGVLGRLEEMAKRKDGFEPDNKVPFKTILPLSDVIAYVIGKAQNTKSTWKIYNALVTVNDGCNEFFVLFSMPEQEIKKRLKAIEDNEDLINEIAENIIKNRYGQIKVEPGFDGDYGIPEIDKKNYGKPRAEVVMKNFQTGLDNFGI